MESTLTSKSQATIPKEVRQALNIGPGDKVKFFIHSDGRVFLLPKLPITALKGLLKAKRHVTIEEMDMFAARTPRRRNISRAA